MWFCWVIFCILTIFSKTYNFKNMSFRFSINSSKHVHFWTLVLTTILILVKFPFQWYISCGHLNFDPTYENGHHDHFPAFWKSEILGLVDYFQVCTKSFLEVIGSYKNVKQEFSIDSKNFTELDKERKSFKRNLVFAFFPAALKKNRPG